MFFNLLKSDFIATKFSPVIDYELTFVKIQLLVKSIKSELRDLNLLLKIRHQELLKVLCLANNLREK